MKTKQLNKLEKQLEELKAQIEIEKNKVTTVIIKELNIEVEKELRSETKFKDIKIPKGWRLLTFQEAVYIYDNKLIKIGSFCEWIKHYSKRMEKKGYASALISNWNDDRLDVNGYSYDDASNGYAFGVRFCRDLK